MPSAPEPREPAQPAPDPSAELLRRWQEDHDRDALDALLRIEVEILRERLRRRGDAALPPALSASDVAQETVMNLIRVREAPTFERPPALRAYLWRSALRLLQAHLERAGARLERLDASATRGPFAEVLATTGGLAASEDDERALALELAIHLLDPEERRILELVYFEGVPLEQAGERLGVAYEAAKKRLARARRRLAGRLGDWSELLQ